MKIIISLITLKPRQQRGNISKTLFLHKNDVQSVADGACWCIKIWLHRFDITRSGVKVNEICYCSLLPQQQLLPDICQFSGKFGNSTPVYRSHSFSDITISQGSIATRLRCGGISVITVLLQIPRDCTSERLLKSANIWCRHELQYGVSLFWLTVYKWLVWELYRAVSHSWNKLRASYRQHSRARCPSTTWSPCRTAEQWRRRWQRVVSSSDARRRCYTRPGRAPSHRRSSRARARTPTWCSGPPSDDRTALVEWLPRDLVDTLPGMSPTYRTPLPKY